MSERPGVRVEGVSKAYRGQRVLDEISFQVPSGGALAVVGPNGAGKSTLLQILAGRRPPDRGKVEVGGEDPFDPGGEAPARLGYLPERPFLYGDLTLGEHLDFVAAVRGLEASGRRAEEDRLLERFGLDEDRDRLCRELSHGMGRKAALILALLHSPEALVLDEPFGGLDTESREALLEELEWRRKGGAALLVSSHDAATVSRCCSRSLLLEPGGGWRLSDGIGEES